MVKCRGAPFMGTPPLRALGWVARRAPAPANKLMHDIKVWATNNQPSANQAAMLRRSIWAGARKRLAVLCIGEPAASANPQELRGLLQRQTAWP